MLCVAVRTTSRALLHAGLSTLSPLRARPWRADAAMGSLSPDPGTGNRGPKKSGRGCCSRAFELRVLFVLAIIMLILLQPLLLLLVPVIILPLMMLVDFATGFQARCSRSPSEIRGPFA